MQSDFLGLFCIGMVIMLMLRLVVCESYLSTYLVGITQEKIANCS